MLYLAFHRRLLKQNVLFLPKIVCYRDQMAEWYRASASGSVDLGFDSESGRTNDFKIGIHNFPA